MTTTDPGFYLDPFDPETFRQWDGERWTLLTRTGPDAAPVERGAKHVGQVAPAPGSSSRGNNAPRTHADKAAPNRVVDNERSNAALWIAVLWAIAAVVIGLVFVFGVQDQAYGGDAYTGIQNTGAQTVRALGWLIIATGPLGLIVALSRR